MSDTLVRKALKLNRLKAFDDGSLDKNLVGSSWREGNAKGANAANPTANSAVRSSHKSVSTANPESPDSETLEEEASRLIATGGVAAKDYAEALRLKENYLALLRKLEYEQKSGSLVDLGVAENILFEQARASRDAWLNWPTRIGPLVAADLGLEADRIVDTLTNYVHQHLQQLGQPENEVEFS
ncbi:MULTISPECIES: hypothetical protein [unclassified Pseudomonas]|uniref:hypothetical protein n=1 Tax=unclassified Pseudomonas TaxID=196821 RepID=UPI002B23DDD0|nr:MULTISPECIES: hypothetical protein [unclassified Pseudomonas]MEA9994317.1 hypothetical protein [Pseudomonas sp. AA4]MEB0126571.1 hypothetical protein [Pseudomonas sp. CCC1.2]MEB0220781.1 hypothetical protein [Pseudomonas sp. AB12(2023)]